MPGVEDSAWHIASGSNGEAGFTEMPVGTNPLGAEVSCALTARETWVWSRNSKEPVSSRAGLPTR